MKRYAKLKVFIITILVFCIMSIPTFAAMSRTVYLAPNQLWTDRWDSSHSRSGQENSVFAKCDSVYPESGWDTFTKIQVRVADTYSNIISADSYYTLTEGEGYTTIPLNDTGKKVSTVYFQFRGNTNKAANASVTYDGR